MSPFTPHGDQARWRIIHGLLREKKVGDVLAYEEMALALGLDPQRDRQVMQFAMRRAAREYEVEDKRAVDSVQNVGYRIVEAAEHLMLARRHQVKANRSIVRGRSKLDNVDLNLIEDPEARRAIELAATVLARQQDMMRRMDLRQRRLEGALAEVGNKAERTDAEVEELRLRLAKLEERLG